jgi:hypothetical protein
MRFDAALRSISALLAEAGFAVIAGAQDAGTVGWEPRSLWVDLDGSLSNPCVAISVAIGTVVLGALSVLRFYVLPARTNLRAKYVAGFKAAYIVAFVALPVFEIVVASGIAKIREPGLRHAASVAFYGAGLNWLIPWAVALLIALSCRLALRQRHQHPTSTV